MKKYLILLLIIISLFSLSACGESDSNSKYVDQTNIKLINIEGVLSYDVDTKIVYYYFKDNSGIGQCEIGFGFMSPYISEHGKFCRYDLNERKIIEIK